MTRVFVLGSGLPALLVRCCIAASVFDWFALFAALLGTGCSWMRRACTNTCIRPQHCKRIQLYLDPRRNHDHFAFDYEHVTSGTRPGAGGSLAA